MSLPTPTDSSVLFTWKIEEFSKIKAKILYSDIFHCGGYQWRLLVYPKGNNTQHLSVYLDVPDAQKLPLGWTIYARYSISVVNQIRIEGTKAMYAGCKFNARESNWGFPYFLPLKELNGPKEGFLVNDTIILEAGVTIPSSLEFEKRIKGTGDSGLGNVEASIGKLVRFLSYWVPSEALILLEKINNLHEGTYVKFSMKGQALATMLLDSFAALIVSMSSTKVNELNEETLRLAANSIDDFEQVGFDLRWLKHRLEEAKGVKKHSDSVNTVESCTSALEVAQATVDTCTSALEVARAKVRELEGSLAKAKEEKQVMSRELSKSLGVNDSVLKDIV